MSRWFDPSAPLSPSDTVAPVRGVYRRIFGHMLLFWRGIGFGTLLAMVSSLFIALQPWPIKFIIDGVLIDSRLDLAFLGDIVSETDGERLRVAGALAGTYLLIVVVGVLLNAGSFYVIARTALYMIHNLRSRLVGHLRSLSLRFHANRSVGDTIWRAINDARSVQEVMIFGVRTWAVMFFRLVIMIALMLVLDPLLPLVSLGVLPLLFYTIHRLTGRIQRTSQESREHMSRLTSLIEQTMGAIRAVQVFGRESTEQRRFEGTSLKFVDAQLRFRRSEQVLKERTRRTARGALGSGARDSALQYPGGGTWWRRRPHCVLQGS